MAPAMQLAARCADGTEIAVEIALAPLAFEGRTVTMATVRDARERIRHLAQLHAAQQRIALAEERERIARDLHDIVIQRLFATGMSIQAVAMRFYTHGFQLLFIATLTYILWSHVRPARVVDIPVSGEAAA